MEKQFSVVLYDPTRWFRKHGVRYTTYKWDDPTYGQSAWGGEWRAQTRFQWFIKKQDAKDFSVLQDELLNAIRFS